MRRQASEQDKRSREVDALNVTDWQCDQQLLLYSGKRKERQREALRKVQACVKAGRRSERGSSRKVAGPVAAAPLLASGDGRQLAARAAAAATP